MKSIGRAIDQAEVTFMVRSSHIDIFTKAAEIVDGLNYAIEAQHKIRAWFHSEGYAGYDGNVDAAVTEYNGGIKQARAVQAGGAPWVPETVQYLQRVRDALASQGTKAPPGRSAGMGVPIMTDPSIQPYRNLSDEAQAEEKKQRDFEEQGAFNRGLGVVVPQIKQAVGAGLAMVGSKTGSEGVQKYGIALFGKGKQEAAAFDDPSASLSNVMGGGGNIADFAKYWAGYGLGQAVESAVTGIAGAAVGGLAGSAVPGAGNAAGAVSGFVGGVIGKGAVKKALTEGAEKILAKEIEAGVARGLTREAAEAAAAPVVKSWVSAETKKAGVRALAAAGASTGLYTQNAAMELGEIYGHYIDQMQQSGRPITQEDEDLALKSALAAAGVETLADLAGIGRLLGTGNKAAGGMLSTIGKEVARGVAREVPTEVGQTAIERFGKQQSLTDADAVRDYVDAAGGAAVPGAMFGGVSGVKRAMAPNSPLSNAANAAGGVPAAAVPGAVPPAAPSAGPAAGAQAGQGAPGGSPQDPLSAKVESLRPFLEDKDLIRSIRGLPELGPESVNELLAAWALARNPQTNPQIRERLLDQVGQFVDSVQNRPNWTFGKQPEPQQAPGMPGVPAVQAGQQGTAMAPAGQPQIGDAGMTLEGQAREVPPEQLKAPPKRALETQQAMQGRAQALAEYEQAFQDLVKAEALGASDHELQAKQQAVREAEAFKAQAEARLKEIRETIEGNRKLESERKRGAILDAVLSDPETANPAERFAAELKRQGFSDAAIQPSEMARIARFEDVKASDIGAGDDNVEPSTPNEMDVAGLIPERKPKQIQQQRKEVSNVRMQLGLTDAATDEERPEVRGGQPPGGGVSFGTVRDGRGERDLAGGNAKQSPNQSDGSTGPVLEASREQTPTVAILGNAPQLPADAPETTQEVDDEGSDQQDGESRDSAPVRAAEGQGYAVSQPAGPWTAEELSDRADLIKPAGEYLAARDQGGQILTGAIDATLRDKDANLGLALPGMERKGLPASLAVTYDQDEYGDPGFAEEFRVEFGGEAVYISKVKLQDDDALAGIPPLVLSTGDELAAYRVDGLPNDLFDFVDAVEQAYAILAERASRSPKGQELDASIATQLEDRPEPTEAQKEAENYQKAHVSVLGLEISIETEKGGERSGTDKDGSRWSVTMPAQYGYIKGTMGADKDHVDIFLGPKPDNGKFFVINQTTPDGQKFDEHKVMLGYDSPEAAQADYLLSFSGDFGGKVFGSIAGPFDLEGFKALIPALAKAKPVAEQVAEAAEVKSTGLASEVEEQPEKASKNSDEAAGPAPEDLEGAEPASALAPTIHPFQHTKTGETIYSVKLPVQVSTPDYQAINRNAIKHKGRYSTFKAAGTIPGFHFRSEENAKAFAADPVVAGVLGKHRSELTATMEPRQTPVLPIESATLVAQAEPWNESTPPAPTGDDGDSVPGVGSLRPAEGDESFPISRGDAEQVVAAFLARFPGAPETVLVERFEDLPPEIQQDAENQGGDHYNVHGVFHNGVMYFVRENHRTRGDLETTIAHELIGHFGLRKLLGQGFVQKTNQLFMQLGGIDGLRRLAAKEGFPKEFDDYARSLVTAYRTDPARFPEEVVRLILTEEAFAHIAQGKPSIRRTLKELIGMVREWLRKLGFFEGQDLNDQDVARIISRVKSKLSKPGGGDLGRNVTVFGKEEKQRPMTSIPESEAPAVAQPAAEASRETPASIRSALVERFGMEGVAKLEADGLLRIAPTMADVPADLRIDGAEAVYDPSQGIAYLVADRIPAGRAAAVVLHELGEHHGLTGFIGDPAWRALKLQVASLAARPGSYAAGAWAGVKASYPEFEGMADAKLAKSDRFIHEVLAKIGESGAEQRGTLWRNLLAAIKRGLLRLGFTFQINEDDVRDLVAGSLRRLMRGDGPGPRGGVPVSEDAQAPMASIPGSIADFVRSPETGQAIKNKVADLFRSGRTFNALHRSIGTQYHKAKVDPQNFGRVFNLAQQYIDDVSRTANEAADQAPDLLPKMERVRDAFSQLAQVRTDERDSRALADPIFTGTMEDKVWSDEELQSRFGLDERQVGLYRQFRAAVDRSLDELALSEMARTAKMSKLEVAPREMDLRQALAFYMEQIGPEAERLQGEMADMKERQAFERRQLEEAAENGDSGADGRKKYAKLLEAMKARHAAEKEALQASIGNVVEMLKATEGKVQQIETLKAQGYAPLMRFGQYTVDVFLAGEDGKPIKDASGEEIRHFFGMFENEAEANAAARVLQEEYPAATVKQGVLSQESFRLFKGVTPETVEVFSRLMGEEQSDVFQKYLKQAVSNRSALKRLIQRKGIAGFEKDPVRVLATFLTSNARATSANYHFGDMLRAASEIPKDKGDVKDEAVKLIDYVQNPQDEAAGLRGLLFMHFLGGSVASAMVNMTQTFTMTMPYLAQFGGNVMGNLKEAMGIASRRLFNRNTEVPEELKQALQRAADEGVVSPHEIHMLQGESMRTGWFQNNRYMRAFGKLWGSFFSLAEHFNRDVAFIAAYRSALARNLGDEEAYAFAKDAVQETQGLYSRANRPNWARGAVGATIFTFKQFSISYMEFLKRLPPRERAIALGVLWVFAGMSGMPFSDDLDDLIDTIAHMLGFAWDNKGARRTFLAANLGQPAAGFLLNGVSYGLPLDISGRMGLANLLPGTALFDPVKKDKVREITEFAGPVGGAVRSYMSGVDRVVTGVHGFDDVLSVAGIVTPVSISNGIKAFHMLQNGYYKDARGRRVIDTDNLDAAFKAMGFNPSVVANSSRAREELMNSTDSIRDAKARISEQWALGIAHRRPDQVAEARAQLAAWNEKNPGLPVRIDLANILRRAREAQMLAADRALKAAPKEMRAQAIKMAD